MHSENTAQREDGQQTRVSTHPEASGCRHAWRRSASRAMGTQAATGIAVPVRMPAIKNTSHTKPWQRRGEPDAPTRGGWEREVRQPL